MKKYLLAVVLFLLVCDLPSYGQQNNGFWVNYTSGLETSNIAFDGDTAWVTTHGGLVSVVSSSGLTTFYNASNSGLNTNELNKVVIDQYHTKWIASTNGLYTLNGSQWKHFLTGNVHEIETDYNNNIWFIGINPLDGTQGLVQYNGNTFTTFDSIPGTTGNYISSISTDKNKQLWILEDKNLIKYDGTAWQVIDSTNSALSGTFVSSMTIDFNSNVWIASYQDIFLYDNSSWMVYDTSNSPLIYSAFDEITPDDSGNVYICNGSQLLKTDGTNWSIYDSTNCPAAQYRFFSCAIDSSKNIWVGTTGNSIYEKDSVQWKHYNTSATGMTNWATKGVVVDHDGNAFINNENSFVIKTDTSWITFDSFPPNCNERYYMTVDYNNVFWGSLRYSAFPVGPIAATYDTASWSFANFNNAICYDISVDPSNNKWFATYDGVVKFDGTNWTQFNTSNSPLLANWVWKVFADKHNNIWISTPTGGFQKYDGTSWQNIDLTALGFASVSPGNICEDLQGNVYISSNGAGNIPPHKLAKFDGTTWSVINQLPGDYIGAMKVDQYNNLWVSFLQTGIAKYDGSTWTMYTIFNSGLPDISSYDMDIDLYNNVWISTQRNGIAVFNERGLNYDTPVMPHFIVSGYCYFDVDSNGVKDAWEPYLNSQRIVANPGNSNYSTNSSGAYSIYLTPGNYSLYPDLNPGWQISSDSSSYNITIDTTSVSGYDFGITAAGIREYELNLYSGINRCGFDVPYWINYKNTGSVLDSGYIEFTLDTTCSLLNSFPAPDQVTGNTYRWNFTNLVPFMDYSVKLNLLIPFSPGDSILNHASLNYYDSSLPVQAASQIINDEIVCAYDPNDKSVRPKGVTAQHLTLKTDTLNYIIRFQNVGNDTAFFVRIIDTLDVNIDLNSIEVISASHSHNLINENGVLIFDFPACNLPDSSVSAANSCGYIHFKARANSQIMNNTIVRNKSSIYFNFNGSIITNEVFNTMVDVILNTYEANEERGLEIVPNPFSLRTIVDFPNKNKNLFSVILTTATGHFINAFNTSEDTFYILKNNLAPGMYFLEIKSNDKRYHGKLMVQ